MGWSENDLIANALKAFGKDSFHNSPNHLILDACEAFYMNGQADEICGDVETFGHYYRIDRWIVRADSQGFKEAFTFDTVSQAKRKFQTIQSMCISAEMQDYMAHGIQ